MTEQRFGHIVVQGTPQQLALASARISAEVQTPHIEDLLDEDFVMEFRSAADFAARKFYLPSGKLAWGHVVGKNHLWIRDNIKPRYQVYAFEHEPFHPYIEAHMTPSKAKRIDALIVDVPGGSAYQNRRNEVLCDCAVEYWWGQGSINDRYYGDIADSDIPTAFAILAEPNDAPPEPPEPPLPLPLPDPQIAALQAQLSACRSTVTTLEASLATANAGKAAAEARVAVLTSAAGYFLGDLDAAVTKYKERAA